MFDGKGTSSFSSMLTVDPQNPSGVHDLFWSVNIILCAKYETISCFKSVPVLLTSPPPTSYHYLFKLK